MNIFKLMKRLSPLILAFAFCLLSSFVSTAADPVNSEDDTYVLVRDAISGNVLYHYSSASTIQYRIIKSGTATSGVDQAFIWNMQNTVDGSNHLTYCSDVDIVAKKGHAYRRLNLEDSPFASNSADLIRAILTHGFYFKEPMEVSDEHEALVNEKVEALAKAAGIPDLHVSEAIAGTQVAIWQAAHGSMLSFDNYARAIFQVSSNTKHYALINKGDYINRDKAVAAANIKALSDYLLTLDPIAASETVVSPASFTKLSSPDFTKNSDGSYNVSVNTTVKVHMESGDTLTLKADLGGHTASASLSNGSQQKTLTIENVPADLISEDVILSISGYQTASDYFYFDSKGDRTESQCMVGYDNSRLPVYAKVVAAEDKIISFHKTTGDANNNFPLKGISFDIYPIASLDEYLSGEYTLKDNPADDIPKVTYSEYTVITDADGRASLNLTQHGLEDGVYLVVEHPHPSIVEPVDPFYVIVPMTNSDTSELEYEVTVRPKNNIRGNVDIEKDVIFLNNNEGSVNAALPHRWIISSSIPHDISTGVSYEITDTLDNRLDYIGNMKITLETVDSSVDPVELSSETDYTLTVNDVDSVTEGDGTKPSDSFKIALTQMGISKIATLIGENSTDNYKLRVYFDAQLNANAEVAEDIPNDASLEYTNTFDFTFKDTSDIPIVRTGAINLLKVDANNKENVLSGATFEVYRPATEDEISEKNENITDISGIDEKVVKVSFYNNLSLTGEPVTSVTTDENGKATISGLAYGKYYLVETQAPSGYTAIANGTEITIDETSHLDERILMIENQQNGLVLPSTGGIGTGLFTFGGLLLMGAACLIFFKNKRHCFES